MRESLTSRNKNVPESEKEFLASREKKFLDDMKRHLDEIQEVKKSLGEPSSSNIPQSAEKKDLAPRDIPLPTRGFLALIPVSESGAIEVPSVNTQESSEGSSTPRNIPQSGGESSTPNVNISQSGGEPLKLKHISESDPAYQRYLASRRSADKYLTPSDKQFLDYLVHYADSVIGAQKSSGESSSSTNENIQESRGESSTSINIQESRES